MDAGGDSRITLFCVQSTNISDNTPDILQGQVIWTMTSMDCPSVVSLTTLDKSISYMADMGALKVQLQNCCFHEGSDEPRTNSGFLTLGFRPKLLLGCFQLEMKRTKTQIQMGVRRRPRSLQCMSHSQSSSVETP